MAWRDHSNPSSQSSGSPGPSPPRWSCCSWCWLVLEEGRGEGDAEGQREEGKKVDKQGPCLLVRLSPACNFQLSELLICVSNNSARFSRSVLSDSLRLHGLQHDRPPCPSPTPGVYPNSSPSRWCHPTISSFVVPFRLQSFPPSRVHKFFSG